MLSVETRYEHIVLVDEKVPVILGTNIKVIELVLDKIAYGWSPEELHFQHPDLTLGQIHSALAYYWDHQDELDQDIESRLQEINRIQTIYETSALRSKLKEKGLL
jgi:uncharacterized protein (DUF433 family)